METLRELEPEHIGEKLRRARERSGVALRDAAVAVSAFEPVSRQGLLNLEKLEQLPIDTRRRLVFFLALICYGYDPVSFGLDWDELPAKWDRRIVLRRLTSGSESAWIRMAA